MDRYDDITKFNKRWEDLRERLTTAGNTYDGNVTNGSLLAQMSVIEEWLREEFIQRPHPKTVMSVIHEE